MKTGTYEVKDGEWTERYEVEKVMKKTAVVRILYKRGGGEWIYGNPQNPGPRYRYPLDLLRGIIEDATYTPFAS